MFDWFISKIAVDVQRITETQTLDTDMFSAVLSGVGAVTVSVLGTMTTLGVLWLSHKAAQRSVITSNDLQKIREQTSRQWESEQVHLNLKRQKLEECIVLINKIGSFVWLAIDRARFTDVLISPEEFKSLYMTAQDDVTKLKSIIDIYFPHIHENKALSEKLFFIGEKVLHLWALEFMYLTKNQFDAECLERRIGPRIDDTDMEIHSTLENLSNALITHRIEIS